MSLEEVTEFKPLETLRTREGKGHAQGHIAADGQRLDFSFLN